VHDREHQVGRAGIAAGVAENRSLRQRSRLAEQALASVGIGFAQCGLEQLAHEAVRKTQLELGSTSREREYSASARTIDRLPEQRRLADAGGPLDQHEATVARPRVREGAVDRGQLSCSLDEQNAIPADRANPIDAKLVPIVSAVQRVRSKNW
jgi:hypothetical protein